MRLAVTNKYKCSSVSDISLPKARERGCTKEEGAPNTEGAVGSY